MLTSWLPGTRKANYECWSWAEETRQISANQIAAFPLHIPGVRTSASPFLKSLDVITADFSRFFKAQLYKNKEMKNNMAHS